MPHILDITPDFHWIGSLDPTLRTFDIVMTTEFGTTYNAYLLNTTEGCVLFETVKDKYFEDYFEKLKSLTSLENIQYIVVDHTEPDHVGSIAKLLEYVPHATVIGSPMALKFLGSIINKPFNKLAVKDSDTLRIGNKTLRFIGVPQLHWPDTIYTYVEEDRLLITCDSFGAHYSDEHILRSSLDADKDADYMTAYKYYYDVIMGPFKPFILKALDKIKNLDIAFICPGHGMVLDQNNMSTYIELYRTWSTPVKPQSRIVIAYVSAYGYTKKLAHAICEGIQNSDYPGEVTLLNMETTPLSSAMELINHSEGLLLGSPTILADALPPIWQIMTSLNPVIHKYLHVGCFGSYGWSGEGVSNMAARLKALRCPMPVEPLAVNFNPSDTELTEAKAFGEAFAKSFIN